MMGAIAKPPLPSLMQSIAFEKTVKTMGLVPYMAEYIYLFSPFWWFEVVNTDHGTVWPIICFHANAEQHTFGQLIFLIT